VRRLSFGTLLRVDAAQKNEPGRTNTDFNRRQITKGLAAGLATTTALTQLPRAAFAEKKLRVAMVVKVLGINYFDVGRDGGQEAATSLIR
jgi:hypothetical protein